jgi:hypothetical protein
MFEKRAMSDLKALKSPVTTFDCETAREFNGTPSTGSIIE